MSLEDVDPPAPPELPEMDADAYEDVEVQGEDYHREDLEAFLTEGAWEEAFGTWAAETDLEEHGFEIARELGLFEVGLGGPRPEGLLPGALGQEIGRAHV